MSDPSLAFQSALFAALGAISGGRIHDQPPPENRLVFPYVTIGEGQSIPVFEGGADCYDGTEIFTQIDVWSRKPGYVEVKEIAADIRSRLHDGELELDGHAVALLRVQSIDYSRDADGLTSRARILVRALTQPS